MFATIAVVVLVFSVFNYRRPIWNSVMSDTKPARLESCFVHIREKVQRGGLCCCRGEGLEIASLRRSGCFIYYLYKTWCLYDSRQDPGGGDEGKRGRWLVIKGGGVASILLAHVLIRDERSPQVTQEVDLWDDVDQNLCLTRLQRGQRRMFPNYLETIWLHFCCSSMM